MKCTDFGAGRSARGRGSRRGEDVRAHEPRRFGAFMAATETPAAARPELVNSSKR